MDDKMLMKLDRREYSDSQNSELLCILCKTESRYLIARRAFEYGRMAAEQEAAIYSQMTEIKALPFLKDQMLKRLLSQQRLSDMIDLRVEIECQAGSAPSAHAQRILNDFWNEMLQYCRKNEKGH